MSVMAGTPAPSDRPGEWLDAAPFRAYVLHLAGAANLHPQEVAALAGVSGRAVQHLVEGRAGRPARRIDPVTAVRLLRLTPAEATMVHVRMVSATRAVTDLALLRTAGWSVAQLAELTRLPTDHVRALASGWLAECPQIVAVRAAAAAGRVDRDDVLPSRPAPPTARTPRDRARPSVTTVRSDPAQDGVPEQPPGALRAA